MAAGVRTRHDLGAAFVLDSERAANVVDVGTQFDNRYLAALPPIDTLRALDATHVFYVRPSTSAVDPSDVLPRLTEYDKGGLPVRKIALDELTTRAAPAANVTNNPLPVPRELPEPYATLASARPELAYAGAYDPVSVFRASYLGAQGKAEGQAHRWRIAPAAAPTPPSNIGVIPVVMSGAGLIVGAEMARRSGSWARGFGGGG